MYRKEISPRAPPSSYAQQTDVQVIIPRDVYGYGSRRPCGRARASKFTNSRDRLTSDAKVARFSVFFPTKSCTGRYQFSVVLTSKCRNSRGPTNAAKSHSSPPPRLLSSNWRLLSRARVSAHGPNAVAGMCRTRPASYRGPNLRGSDASTYNLQFLNG